RSTRAGSFTGSRPLLLAEVRQKPDAERADEDAADDHHDGENAIRTDPRTNDWRRSESHNQHDRSEDPVPALCPGSAGRRVPCHLSHGLHRFLPLTGALATQGLYGGAVEVE